MKFEIVLTDQQKAAVESEIVEANKRIDLENQRAKLDHERRKLDAGGDKLDAPKFQKAETVESYVQRRVDEFMDAVVRQSSQRTAESLRQRFEAASPDAQKAVLAALEQQQPPQK